MQREEIRLEADQARMIRGGRVLSEVECGQIESFYIVALEDPLFSGDEPFYVALFPSFLWVIPYLTPGTNEFFRAIEPTLEASGAVFRATSRNQPFAWRRRWLGFLPLFPVPDLGCHPRSSRPKWEQSEPMRPSDTEEFLSLA